MQDIYFNFSESLDEQHGVPVALIGSPVLLPDAENNNTMCLFLDGSSALKVPDIRFEKRDFSIECVFRNTVPVKEQGVYGSNGFRLALRSDRRTMSYTGWVNFPSSVSPKRIIKHVDPDKMCKVHYSVMTRKGNTFSFYLDGVLVGTLDYDYNFWQLPFYIGYYYDMIYAFTGYIREFKISFDNVVIPAADIPIPKTLKG